MFSCLMVKMYFHGDYCRKVFDHKGILEVEILNSGAR